MIRQINGKFYVYSHDGKKRLSKGYATRKEAERRLAQIELLARRIKRGVRRIFEK